MSPVWRSDTRADQAREVLTDRLAAPLCPRLYVMVTKIGDVTFHSRSEGVRSAANAASSCDFLVLRQQRGHYPSIGSRMQTGVDCVHACGVSPAKPPPVRIAITDLDTIAILRQATARHDAMSRANTSYRRSTLTMQDTGLLGEKAVAHWLRQHHPKVVEIGDDENAYRNGSGDVAIERAFSQGWGSVRDWITFEVKTSRISSWRHYERTLDAEQLARSNAHAYIWCVVSDTWPTESVFIMGWLPIDEIKTPNAGQQTTEHDRPHVRLARPMKDMRTLRAWWETVPFVPF